MYPDNDTKSPQARGNKTVHKNMTKENTHVQNLSIEDFIKEEKI